MFVNKTTHILPNPTLDFNPNPNPNLILVNAPSDMANCVYFYLILIHTKAFDSIYSCSK